MRKSFCHAVSRRSPKTSSHSEACKGSTFDASRETALPSWVSQDEPPLAGKKTKHDSRSRQKQNCLELDGELAPPSQITKLMTVAEAAWRLNLSEKTIRRMIEAGNLAIIRIGRSIRIHPEVIEKIVFQDE